MSTNETILKEFNKAVKALRFYPDNHPNLNLAMDAFYKTLNEGLGARESIVWTVDKRGFYERQQPILPDQEWLINFAKEFFLRHIKGVTISNGISQEEIKGFLYIFKEEPDDLLKRGSVGAQMADMGIKGIIIEDVHYKEVHKTTKEVAEEKQGETSLDFMIGAESEEAETGDHSGGLETDSIESILQGFDGFDEEEKEKTLPELIAELNLEDNTGRYIGLASDISDKATRFCAEKEWDSLCSILDTFLLHSSEVGGKPDAIATVARDSLQALLSRETIIHLIERLGHSREEQLSTIQQILLLAEQDGVKLLLNALAEIKQANARRTIYNTLLLYGNAVRDEAERRINDERWFVVRQMVSLLGAIGNAHTISVLAAAMQHPEARVRKEVIKSLGQIPCKEALALLLSTLDGSDRSLILNATIALGVLKNPAAIEPLGRIANKRNTLSDNLEIRKEAVRALGLIGNERAIPHLTRLITKKVWFGRQDQQELRALAVISLGKIGGEAARRVIKHTAKRARGVVQQACDKTLKETP
ncbi:MAG: HEAT repeat domain-containing protein [Thermodesulfobacteriota bacterium]